MKKYQNEVEQILKKIKPVSKPSIWKAENYVGGGRSSLTFLDLKVPDVRGVFKRGFSFYSPKKNEFQKTHLDVFNYIWMNSQNHETLSICLYYIKSLSFDVRKKNRALILKWLDRVDNWALSDEISSVFSEFLEDDPSLLATYKKWNKSKNPWERRQSLVGLIFYSRFRKQNTFHGPKLDHF